RVLRPPQGIHDCRGAPGRRGRGEHLADLQELILGSPADPFYHLGCIARVVLLHQLIDAARVRERWVRLDVAVRSDLVVPAGPVVAVSVSVVARVLTYLKGEILADDEG